MASFPKPSRSKIKNPHAKGSMPKGPSRSAFKLGANKGTSAKGKVKGGLKGNAGNCY
jgi:hypothetical protein